jgi:cell division protein FtsZ
MLEFNMPKNKSSRIKVIGVGGGGTNAVNHMFRLGIKDVDLVVANTDRQSLDASPVLNKIQLGEELTEGLGAGTNPLRGREAAMESLAQIKEILSCNTKMLFITAGMGGGTGTGASPVIAEVARELGLLTVGIVTTPFDYEGNKTNAQALEGIEELKKYTDAVIVISNETLRTEYGDMDIDNAYCKADDILATAAKSIAECITTVGTQNVDFEDVRVALKNSGVALIGNGSASGIGRAIIATEKALESRLLNDKEISGAKFILINVTYGKKKITLDELNEVAMHIRKAAGDNVQIKQGRVFDDSLEDTINVTIIATGFNKVENRGETILIAQKQMIAPSIVTNTIDVSSSNAQPITSVNQITNRPNDNHNSTFNETSFTNLFDLDINPAEKMNVEDVIVELEVETNPALNEEIFDNEIIFSVSQTLEPLVEDNLAQNLQALLDNSDNDRIEQMKKNNELRDEERRNALRQLNYNVNKQNTPAYQQKNVPLDVVDHSSANSFNEYSMIRNADNMPEIKRNSYLHDKLD